MLKWGLPIVQIAQSGRFLTSPFKIPCSLFNIPKDYFNNSQGFNPVCFLNAAEKCEIDE